MVLLYFCNCQFPFCRLAKRPRESGRRPIFSQQQEGLIIDMVLQDNAIRLKEIQKRVIEDDSNFGGINNVSLSTIDRVLQRNIMRLRQS